jgi:hypothetical protein
MFVALSTISLEGNLNEKSVLTENDFLSSLPSYSI